MKNRNENTDAKLEGKIREPSESCGKERMKETARRRRYFEYCRAVKGWAKLRAARGDSRWLGDR